MLEQVTLTDSNAVASSSDWKGKGKARVHKSARANERRPTKSIGRLIDELTKMIV